VKKEVVIIGGGPAGLAAAVKLRERGIREIVILEREENLGGILRQCIHDGFGLTRFRESLSGPEYARRFIERVWALDIPYVTEASVIGLGADRHVTAATRNGLIEYEAEAVVLAMGCRERTRGALAIPGERPAGIYTAGIAQAYINLHNMMIGREAVILGSGDIGMIMARRLTLEGAKVKGVFEILPYPCGLPRNVTQCLDDFGIPLHLSHTVVDIKGRSRLEGVTVARVDESLVPIPGTEYEIPCDSLILSVGLIPENELSLGAGVVLDLRTKGPEVDEFFRTNVPGIFATGNVLQVHDLVDFVSLEAEKLADAVARHLAGGLPPRGGVELSGDGTVGYVLPRRVGGAEDFTLSLRVKRPFRNCEIRVTQAGHLVKSLRLRKAIPAEMIRIPIRAADLAGAGAPAAAGAPASAGPLEVGVLC